MSQPIAVPERPNPVATIIKVLAIVGAAILLLGSVLQLLHLLSGAHGSALRGLAHTFYADEELGVWAWFNALLFSLLAVAFFLRSVVHRTSGRPAGPLVVLGAVALYLSADETAALHEKLRIGAQALHLHTGTYDWVVLGAPLALIALAVLYFVARRLDRALLRGLIIAAVVYVLGAAGLEYVGGVIAKTPGLGASSPLYVLEVTIEEGLEAAGILTATWAALAGLVFARMADGFAVSMAGAPADERTRTPVAQRS